MLLVIEQGLLRASLGHLLAAQPDLDVVDECGTYVKALEVLRTSRIDVVLPEFTVGAEQVLDFISEATREGYQGRFLILTGSLDGRKSAIAFKHGASGVFLQSDPPEQLVQAIRLVAGGGVWVDQRIFQLLVDRAISRGYQLEEKEISGSLKDRERRVLLGIVDGLTNKKIADSIGLSLSAVKNVVQRLFSKTGTRTRGQLVRAALEGSMDAIGELRNQRQTENVGRWRSGEMKQTGAAAPPTPRPI